MAKDLRKIRVTSNRFIIGIRLYRLAVLLFYTGNNIPEWNHNLFVASLGGKHIIRLQLNGNKVVGEERLLVSENQRFRDVCMGKDGKLYAITNAGRMYYLGKE